MKKLTIKTVALAILCVTSYSVPAYGRTLLNELDDIANQIEAGWGYAVYKTADALDKAADTLGVNSACTYVYNKIEAIEARYPGIMQGIVEGAVLGSFIGSVISLGYDEASNTSIVHKTEPGTAARGNALAKVMAQGMKAGLLTGVAANIAYSVAMSKQ